MLYADGVSAAAARSAVAKAGGRVVEDDARVGFALARSSDPAFADRVAGQRALAGASQDRPIGYAPAERRTRQDQVERLTADRRTAAAATRRTTRAVSAAKARAAEPLSDRQWDMRQIGATVQGSYRLQRGDSRVLVGVIDTGIDASHPDVKRNFDRRLSRNFVRDWPWIDGKCEYRGCKDPVDVDNDGHGTHVASTIGAPLNGIGIGGVAPGVRLVNIRAGHDSGYFFLYATIKALVYAGDAGVDVVNMSFFTDPWLYNCLDNPADSPREQRQQRTIRTASARAMRYAIAHGVTPVAAAGNEFTDLGHPKIDTISPDYPPNHEKTRRVDNSCITVPTELPGVNVVSATGFSTRKSYYSNYGTEQIDVAAPGGDAYDTPDNTPDPRNEVLAAYPKSVAEANGDIDRNGNPTSPFVVKDCKGKVCAYYQYLQGTSMASPHAAGVAALIVSQHGTADRAHRGGLTMAPSTVRTMLKGTAVEHSCPSPRRYHYKLITSKGPASFYAYCAGPMRDNGFYGRGIVNAWNVVRGH